MIRFLEHINNIVDRVYTMARMHPEEIALILPSDEHLSYREVQAQVENLRENLRVKKFSPRERVLVLFPFDEKFVFLIMALFAEGLVPVIIDPRVQRKRWRNLLQHSGVKRIFMTSKIKRWRFLAWWMNRFELLDIAPLFKEAQSTKITPLTMTSDHDEVLVTLTSGTTGAPKTVSRNFGIIKNQQLLSCKYLPAVSRDIHLALYGIGVLQSLAEGACTVILPTAQQQVDTIIKSIQKNKITRFSGPPGVLTDFLLHIEKHNIQLPSLENIITGGAPLPRWWLKKVSRALPHTQVTILYGSTECEPISALDIRDIPDNAGYPVALPIQELQLTRTPFTKLNGHEVFEIVLKGPNCAANSPKGLQTGDLAYEKDGLLWLLGRKTEVINHIPVGFLEEPLERVEGVKRVAIYHANSLQICFEALPGVDPLTLIAPLEQSAEKILTPYGFKQIIVISVKKIPVDPRHGWKIQRSLLKK